MKSSSIIKMLVSLPLICTSLQASAESDRYANYPEDGQENFITVSVPAGKQQIEITALQNGGQFRLAHFQGTGAPQFTLQGPGLKDGMDSFLTACEKYRSRGIFQYIQSRNNRYVLKGEIFPLHKENLNKLFPGLVDETLYSEREITLPIGPEFIGPHGKSLGLSPQRIRDFFEKQIQKQHSEILKTGKVEFDLTGQDSMVCDLVSGGSKLKFVAGFVFPVALPIRKSIISSEQLTFVVKKLEELRPRKNDSLGRLVFYAGAFGKALSDVAKIEPSRIGEDKFDRIARTVLDFNTASLRLKMNDVAAIQRAAKSLDEKFFDSKFLNIWVQPEIVGEVR